MKTFLQTITETKNKTVALVAGSFRPPHAGHFDMIQQYAKKADEVLVIISNPTKNLRTTKTGAVITAKMAKAIFEIYIKRYRLHNVKLEISDVPSPITAVFDYVDNNLSDCNVILGVSKKDSDWKRYQHAKKYFDTVSPAKGINILDPKETAVEPTTDDLNSTVSATDIRKNIDNKDFVKSMLPKNMTSNDVDKIFSILNGPEKLSIKEAWDLFSKGVLINDDMLKSAKLAAYNTGTVVLRNEDESVPYNPKKFPDKAIDIVFSVKLCRVEIYLDTELKVWCSKCMIPGTPTPKCLSTFQMLSFFKTMFYHRLISKLTKTWPLSDNFYKTLYKAVKYRHLNAGINLSAVDEDEGGALISPTQAGPAQSDIQSKPSGSISRNDVLGKYDPEKGVFGPGDFNLPKSVFKRPLSRNDPLYVDDSRKKKHLQVAEDDKQPTVSSLTTVPKYLYYFADPKEVDTILASGLHSTGTTKKTSIRLSFVEMPPRVSGMGGSKKTTLRVSTANLDTSRLFLDMNETGSSTFYYQGIIQGSNFTQINEGSSPND